MSKKMITLLMDGRTPISVDEEEFEIIKLMVQDAGALTDRSKMMGVVNDLVSQKYPKVRAMELCILAASTFKGQ